MKCNQHIQIKCDKVVLVPYEKKHVPKYHKWMKSEELQLLTASEPLTLEQEYEMQLSWRKDNNKCTFILLDSDMLEHSGKTEIDCMVGDVNLFFNDEDNPKCAEIEIMIAEKTARRKGYGKEALNCMMRYGFDSLGVTSYTAKIRYTNESSLRLFAKLGFVEVSRSDVFQEVTYQLGLTDKIRTDILAATQSYKIVPYTD